MKHGIITNATNWRSWKLQGRLKVQGLPISIENDRGTYRQGIDNHGKVWRSFMHIPYGYIRATEGVDGDHVDVYVGPSHESRRVFIVHQNDPVTNKYDEDKCMLGFNTQKEARAAYIRQYDRPDYYGSMTEVDMAEFKNMLKTRKGLKLKKSCSGILKEGGMMRQFPQDSLIKSDTGIWYVKMGPALQRFHFSGTLPRLSKAYYSPEEVKAQGMRWVTIRGSRVLIKPLKTGGYAVVGGAGGRLNHLKIDRIVAKKIEAKAAKLQSLTLEEVKEAAVRKRAETAAKKEARADYTENIQRVLGVTHDDLVSQISTKDMDMIANKARIMVEGRAKVPKDFEEAVEQQQEKEINKVINQKIRNIEHTAMSVLMDDYSPADPNIQETLEELLDTEKAMEILQAKKEFKARLKAIGSSDADISTTLKVGDVVASRVSEEEIMQDIENAREVSRNVELYDKLNAQSASIQRYIDQGAASALNGVLGDVYKTGATFSSDTIENLGLDTVARIIASKIQADGRSETVKQALEDYVSKERLKVVENTIKESDRLFQNAEHLRELARDTDDAEAILSMASANGHALKQITAGQQMLGTSVGSLRAVTHVINALDMPPKDTIQADLGKDIFKARERARNAGLRKGSYSIKTTSDDGGGTRMILDMPRDTVNDFFAHNAEMRAGEDTLTRIKRHEMNTGYRPPGIKSNVTLDAAQEAGVHAFQETGKMLFDYEAGKGKTLMALSCVTEAIHNKGAKKVLIVTPSSTRGDFYDQARSFMTPEMFQKLEQSSATTPKKTRRERHGLSEGIHIISHDALREDASLLKNAGYDMVVMDEIHEMTAGTGKAGRYQGMQELRDVPLKVGMSGTNIKNKKEEVYRKIDWINPDHHLGSMEDFSRKYKGLNQGTGIFADAANEAFRKDISRYTYTQKNRLDVKNTVERKSVSLSATQRKAYAASERKYRDERDQKLRGAAARRDARNYAIVTNGEHTSNGKIQEVLNLMNNHTGEKAVIHVTGLNPMRSAAQALETNYGAGSVGMIHGSTRPAEMAKIKAEFNNPDSPMRFIVGTRSIESGHNLQGGGTVTFHLDIPNTYSAFEQRNARIFRKGQTHDTKTYLLAGANPLDMRMESIMETKRREQGIMGNSREVESLDETGFFGLLNSYERGGKK